MNRQKPFFPPRCQQREVLEKDHCMERKSKTVAIAVQRGIEEFACFMP